MLSACASRIPTPCRQLFILLAIFSLGFFIIASAHAADYYVATSGSDSNPGSEAKPFRTIAKGSQRMASGDTLYIRAGTYNEGLMHGYGGFKFVNGTPGAYTRYAAYPGEEALAHGYTKNDTGRVIIKPPRGWMGSTPGGATFVIWMSRNTQYIEISGLVIDGTNGSIPDTTSHYGPVKLDGSYEQNIWAKNIRLIKNDIRYGAGIYGGGGSEIIGNWIHNMGVYGIYTSFDNGLFEGNLVEDIAGYGIHLFQQQHPVNGWVIRNNIVRRSGGNYYPTSHGRSGAHRPLPGVILTRGSNWFYNNLVYDNPYGGVSVYGNGDKTLVANNTIYGNGNYGISVADTVDNARIINNISYGNKGTQIKDNGKGTVLSNNLTTDPMFEGAPSDFGLRAGSPAIDKGATLAEVKTDFTGKARPEGAAYDIGAYEFGSPPDSGSPPPNPTGGGSFTPGAPVLLGPNGEVCHTGYLPLQ